MKFLILAHGMPPRQCAGSEISVHALAVELQGRGHEVRMIVSTGAGTYQGVVGRSRATRADGLWADLIIGQQDLQVRAVQIGVDVGRPVAIWQHTWAHQEGALPVVVGQALMAGATVIANSETAAAALRDAHGVEPLVMRPLVRVDDYQVTLGDKVGLVNLQPLKGGDVLATLAVACPDRQFVGRRGWGVIRQRSRFPGNVVTEPMSPDMASFYRQIRVLLMPALQESWGRVGIEAACSGIPTIAHPTPGLREALGDAAIWVDREDTDGWIEALARLDDPEFYGHRSLVARQRAAELELVAMADIDRFEVHFMTEPAPATPKIASTDLRVAVLVPWKAGDPKREASWTHVCKHWETNFPDWLMVEGVYDEEPFSRARAINTAARIAGPHDVLILADADTLIDPGQVRAAVEAAVRTGRIAFAHDEFRGLSATMSERILAGFDGCWDRGVQWELPDTASSCVAVPWALWERVGGFDERFTGWGYEDVAFSLACQVLGGGFERITGPVWHLWHAKSPTNRPGSPTYVANAALCRRYDAAYRPPDLAAMNALVAEAKSFWSVAP